MRVCENRSIDYIINDTDDADSEQRNILIQYQNTSGPLLNKIQLNYSLSLLTHFKIAIKACGLQKDTNKMIKCVGVGRFWRH